MEVLTFCTAQRHSQNARFFIGLPDLRTGRSLRIPGCNGVRKPGLNDEASAQIKRPLTGISFTRRRSLSERNKFSAQKNSSVRSISICAADENCNITSNGSHLVSTTRQHDKSTNSWTRMDVVEGFARNIRRTLSLAITKAHFY